MYRKSQVKLAAEGAGLLRRQLGGRRLDGFAPTLKNLDILTYVERGAKVVGPNPTCPWSCDEYPELLEEADRSALKLADAMMDHPNTYGPSEKSRFNKDFKSAPGEKGRLPPVPPPGSSKGFKGRDMLKQIPGVKPVLAMDVAGMMVRDEGRRIRCPSFHW